MRTDAQLELGGRGGRVLVVVTRQGPACSDPAATQEVLAELPRANAARQARADQMNSDTAASRISAIAVAAPIGSSSPSSKSSRLSPNRSIVI
jgi:hypothetical protein